MVAPPVRPAETAANTESAVAPGAHSLPQLLQRTGVSLMLRAAMTAPELRTPYGGRKNRGRWPVALDTTLIPYHGAGVTINYTTAFLALVALP